MRPSPPLAAGRRRLPALAALAGALVLAGCGGLPALSQSGAVAVDASVPQDFQAAAMLAPTDSPADLARWWQRFDDPVLTTLLEELAADSLDLRTAESRVREARAAVRQSEARRLFTLDAGAGATARSTTTLSSGGGSVGSGSAETGVTAAWEADLFGGVESSITAAGARALAQEIRLGGTLVALNGDIAETYFTLRGLQQRLALADQALDLQRRTRTLVREQAAAGLVTALDVERADAAVSRLEAQRPALVAGIDQAINQLSILVGRPPGALRDRLTAPTPVPTTAVAATPGVPADLIRRRPDLRAAEADVLAAAAARDVAIADFYPRLTIPGSITLSSTGLGTATTVESLIATLGASLSIPLFDGGRRQAALDIAEETTEQALIAYRRTLLTALNEVEAALIERTEAEQRREALARTAASSERAVALSTELFSQGLSSFLDVLDAQRELAAARQNLVDANVDVGRATVRLYKALGGGWDGRPLAAANLL